MPSSKRRAPLFIAAVILLTASVVLSGCLPPGSLPAENATNTAQAQATGIQQTVEAALAASAVPTTPAATATEIASPTAAETSTPVPTATPSVPIARVNQNTNCRSGNSAQFDLLYIALAGSELTITGRTTDPAYVLVENPDRPGTSCWLWTRYVDILGDISTLAVSTPPPTPTPALAFTISFSEIDGCVGWDPEIKIVNTGGVTLKSWQMTVEDLDTATSLTDSLSSFDELDGCPATTTIPKLDPGDTGYAYVWSFVYDPSGHSMKATVKACSGTGLGGLCATKSINFTP
ncbi:MAG: hypothetical protein WBR18_02700 [Anaerolineales bacterium]